MSFLISFMYFLVFEHPAAVSTMVQWAKADSARGGTSSHQRWAGVHRRAVDKSRVWPDVAGSRLLELHQHHERPGPRPCVSSQQSKGKLWSHPNNDEGMEQTGHVLQKGQQERLAHTAGRQGGPCQREVQLNEEGWRLYPQVDPGIYGWIYYTVPYYSS